ncbi:MAG: hypothetical protein VB025_09055 [Sphaerochaeta sp.]|nr:hypothetical protein [Sphaerochaeta sp.]
MKKIIFLVVALCALGFVLVGCADSYTNPESRELVVFNDTTDQEITMVSIRTYISTERVSAEPNALPDGETILPGAKMSFYLPPFPDETTLKIASSATEGMSEGFGSANIHRENYILDDGVSVEARYYYDENDDDGYGDGYLIELGGDGYALPVDL